MPAQIISIFQNLRGRDWSPGELAQFYRVENALLQAGLQLEADRGLTDEGEPWFVFCRADTGDVFIHFARIDGAYIAVGAALEQVVHGRDFSALIEEMLAAQAFSMARTRKHSNIFPHPAALLIALVGGAFFHSSQAKAAETTDHVRPDMRRHTLPILAAENAGPPGSALDLAETATILSGVLFSMSDPNRYAWADTISQQVNAAGAALPTVPVVVAPLPAVIAADAGSPVPDLSATLRTATTLVDSQLRHLAAFAHNLGAVTFSPAIAPGIVVGSTLNPDMRVAAHASISSVVEVGVAAFANGGGLVRASSSDAAQALQAADVLGSVQTQPSPAVFVQTGALKGLIDHGAHFVVGAPTDIATSEPTSPTIPQPPTSTPAPVGPSAPAGLAVDSPRVLAAIVHFTAEVGALDIANAAHGVVLYDGALFSTPSSIPALDSITFTFTDGSSISLVGTAAEIQHLYLS